MKSHTLTAQDLAWLCEPPWRLKGRPAIHLRTWAIRYARLKLNFIRRQFRRGPITRAEFRAAQNDFPEFWSGACGPLLFPVTHRRNTDVVWDPDTGRLVTNSLKDIALDLACLQQDLYQWAPYKTITLIKPCPYRDAPAAASVQFSARHLRDMKNPHERLGATTQIGYLVAIWGLGSVIGMLAEEAYYTYPRAYDHLENALDATIAQRYAEEDHAL